VAEAGPVREAKRIPALAARIWSASATPGHLGRPIFFLVIAFAIAGVIAPAFLSAGNLSALLVSSSFLIVISVGEALVILMGMIDLGVQSVLAAAGMLAAYLVVFGGASPLVAVPATLGFGVAAGALVGLLVTWGKVPSFIVTLGTYWGFTGVALLFNAGNEINPYAATPPRPFGFAALAGHTLGVSHLILISVLVVIIGQGILSWTPAGTWIRAVGSNEAAAVAVGVNVPLLKTTVFIISGGLAALAGLMITAWQDSIYPLTGQGFSLQAIAGVILGGIPFTGGRGTIVGAALGVLIIGLIDDLIVLLGLPALYEYIFVAVILVVAGLQARTKGFTK
jgi:ribose/xylose/arabinose/galactoside ABC-type transport system permease subunit